MSELAQFLVIVVLGAYLSIVTFAIVSMAESLHRIAGCYEKMNQASNGATSSALEALAGDGGSGELELREGVILRVNEQGLGIVKDTHSQEQFVFTFDKIAGYRGERAHELGLIAGAYVRFNVTAGTQVVFSVELLP